MLFHCLFKYHNLSNCNSISAKDSNSDQILKKTKKTPSKKNPPDFRNCLVNRNTFNHVVTKTCGEILFVDFLEGDFLSFESSNVFSRDQSKAKLAGNCFQL